MNESEQLELIPREEELDFELRSLPLESLAHIETPIAPKRELVESIRLIGMLQPPMFREDASGHLDIIVGRRRIAAARLAGLETVRALVAKTSASVADVMTLAENAIRSANTVTEFEAIERLTKRGFDLKSIRAMTGMPYQTIKKRQALLRLSPTLTEAFKAGKMTATVADGAAKLPNAVQDELAMTLVKKAKITASDLHDVKQARAQAAMQSALFDDLVETADEPEAEPEAEDTEPIELTLASEIRSVIERLPDYIVEGQRSVKQSLEWAASFLIDLAMGVEAKKETITPFAEGPPDPLPPDSPYAASYGYFDASGNPIDIEGAVPVKTKKRAKRSVPVVQPSHDDAFFAEVIS